MKRYYIRHGQRSGTTKSILSTYFTVIIVVLLSVQVSADNNDFDPLTLEKVWEYTKEDNEATFWKLAWSPDGKMVAATFFDNKCIVLNASDGQVLKELVFSTGRGGRCDGFSPEGTKPLRACAFSPDGRYLALGGDDMEVFVLNATTWEREFTLTGHTGSILCLDFSPDSRYLASGCGEDKVVAQDAGENVTRIWDMEDGFQILTLTGHMDGVLGVKWSHDGQKIATVSDDKTARIWAFPSGELLMEMTSHTVGVLDVDWSPDDGKLITGSRDYKIKVWNTSSGNLLVTWEDNNCVRSVDIHPNGELAATSGVDLTLKIRDMETGSSLKVIKDGVKQKAMVMSSRWSPDGVSLASGLGISHTVIMYRFGIGSGEDAEEYTAIRSILALVIISVIFLIALYYPIIRKIRGRRG